MKKLLPIFLFVISSTVAFANIRTVSNIDAAARYTTIQAACDASNSGDSIYASGSPLTYASFSLREAGTLRFAEQEVVLSIHLYSSIAINNTCKNIIHT